MLAAAHDLLFPLGQSLGRAFASDGERGAPRVRVGDSYAELPERLFDCWRLVRDLGALDAPPTVESLQTLADARGLDDRSADLQTLISAGLVSAVPVDYDAVHAFAGSVRLQSAVNGYGPAADLPGRFEVGVLGQTIIDVGAAMYGALMWSDVSETLLGAVEPGGLAETADDMAVREMGLATQLLEGVLGLPELLAWSAAYLDATGAAR
ncbi:hypothetical protein [Blastococcus sp. Marseille-P5729]|uniref:hypothetical protein n=1 Tax=Blastococcus sp. Marseille-P5729 TaxID=2086582 RepID=UPI000D101BB7|nr:hypothetical protein [Blastococcus sp. Marseille-P5729]